MKISISGVVVPVSTYVTRTIPKLPATGFPCSLTGTSFLLLSFAPQPYTWFGTSREAHVDPRYHRTILYWWGNGLTYKDLSLTEVCNSVLSVVMMRELIYEWLRHKIIDVPQQWSVRCRLERKNMELSILLLSLTN